MTKQGRPIKESNFKLSDENIDKLITDGASLSDIIKLLKKAVVERALNAELNHHLKEQPDNARNGYGQKTVITDQGELDIKTPRDRNASFEPKLIAKRQRRLAGFDEKVIALYARGMTVKEIQYWIEDIYATEVSPELISEITDEVIEQVKSWQNRPLDRIYPIVYLDAMMVKIQSNGRVARKPLYLAMAVNMAGHKEILGMWLADNIEGEGAKFWLAVINEIKHRGCENILIACVDGLKGFPEAINAVYPEAQVQRCIVHLLRQSLNYVPWKERKQVAADLKPIYTALNEETARQALDSFRAKWDSKYMAIGASWHNNWAEIVPFLAYPADIRKAIYTTNAIEAVNRQIRKIIKAKGLFPNHDAVYKIVFLALQNAKKSWTMPIQNWKLALNQFHILFPEQVNLTSY